jgi:hypothetical protein
VSVTADLGLLDTSTWNRTAEVWDELRAMGPDVTLLINLENGVRGAVEDPVRLDEHSGRTQ